MTHISQLRVAGSLQQMVYRLDQYEIGGEARSHGEKKKQPIVAVTAIDACRLYLSTEEAEIHHEHCVANLEAAKTTRDTIGPFR